MVLRYSRAPRPAFKREGGEGGERGMVELAQRFNEVRARGAQDPVHAQKVQQFLQRLERLPQ